MTQQWQAGEEHHCNTFTGEIDSQPQVMVESDVMVGGGEQVCEADGLNSTTKSVRYGGRTELAFNEVPDKINADRKVDRGNSVIGSASLLR